MNEEITLNDIIKAIYPESQTNLLDNWLREWQAAQERKA